MRLTKLLTQTLILFSSLPLLSSMGSTLSAANKPASDNASTVLGEFRGHILNAIKQPGACTLFKEHCLSLISLCEITWNDVQKEKAEVRDETLNFIKAMNEGLAFDASRPEVYFEEGKRSLVLAFTSEADGSLQYYSCALPPHFDPARAYPLVVDLHGHGSDNRLFYVFIHIAIPPDKEGYLKPHASNETDVITIRPWGRGNKRYLNDAEQDVWQSIADAKKRFKIDESRQYLQGHSMGGFATWRLAGEHPELWAAICICAGGAKNNEELASRLVNTPVRIWHGDKDPSVEVAHAYRMQKLLEAAGAKEVGLVILPNHGHESPNPAEELANREWFLRHKLR